jgi:hypothetical protein
MPLAMAAPPAARTPFQSTWALPNPMLPLGVLTVIPPNTADESAPQAVVSIAPPTPYAGTAILTQFAIAFGIAGQGAGAVAPPLPDGASVTVVVETQLATGGDVHAQEFTVSTITPNNPDWKVAVSSPPANPSPLSPTLTVTLIQSSMTALTTLPFLLCQLTDATCVFTGRFAIIWYANTPALPSGTTAFTLGTQWAAFAGTDQILLPALLRTFPPQLPATSCGVLQTAAGSITCSGSTAMPTASLLQQDNSTSPRPQSVPQSHLGSASDSTDKASSTTLDIALLTAASVVAVVVCVIFIVFVPRFILRLKRK